MNTRVVEGPTAARGLTAAIRELQPAITVLGSRAGTAPGVVTAGRTAHHVLHEAGTGVCVAPAGAAPAVLRTVGAAVTDTPEAWEALAVAAALARSAGAMRADARIEDDVRAEIDDDPRLRDPDEIAISATDGIVTLRGTLGSFSQRRAAVADAKRIPGVYTVKDQLQVRLLNDERREDADIRGAALQSIMWDADLPTGTVDVNVVDGWVTLTGEVDYQYQSDEAYEDVAGLFGVVGVTNEIRVVAPS